MRLQILIGYITSCHSLSTRKITIFTYNGKTLSIAIKDDLAKKLGDYIITESSKMKCFDALVVN